MSTANPTWSHSTTRWTFLASMPNGLTKTWGELQKTDAHKSKYLHWKHHFSQFRLSYYPHRLEDFSGLLKSVFGTSAKHSIYGDFQPLGCDRPNPAFYIHVIAKPQK